MQLKKLSITLFEISLVFLLLQQAVFPSQMTTEALGFNILCGALMIGTHKKLHLNAYLFSMAAFLAVATVATLLGHGEGDGITRVIRVAAQTVSSLCIYDYLMRIRSVERFMKLYIAVNAVALVMIMALLGDRMFTSRFGHNGSGAIVSYYIGSTPIYKSSNATANLCAISVLFLMYFAEFKKKRWCYVLAVLFAVCLLLCGSRKGLLALAVYVIYMLFFMNKGVTVRKLALLALIPVAAYVVFTKIPLFYNIIGKRMVSLVMNYLGYANSMDGSSYIVRARLAEQAKDWILAKPLFGYGFNTFNRAMGYGAESNLLQIALEFGIVGLFVYYSFLPAFIARIWRNARKNVLTMIFSVLAVSILAHDVAGVTYSWQHMTMWYSVFWAVQSREKGKTNRELLS